MGIFNFKKKQKTAAVSSATSNEAELSKLVLNNIAEGVVIIDSKGMIKLLNPAAAALTGHERPDAIIGLNYVNVIQLQNQQGSPFVDAANPLVAAVKRNEPYSSRKLLIVTSDNQRQVAVHLTMIPTGGPTDDKIITFRDITKELADENEQAEFISTASHEMRTPVAAIEGYLSLALNPQTATIDARAQQYLTEAHNASKHLGELFKDLLDVTKLDDGRLQPHPVPIEVVSTVKGLADDYGENITAKNLTYTFGTDDGDSHKLEQIVYASLDISFLREIMDNLIGNAVKYTPEGGHIWVNVRGDGDKVLINVTDSGIGISTDDLTHIFQKFYRVDNSATRSIGGTGLGLYLVKQRVEAMGGRVWAESVFGEGSTFYISFPRLTESEYQRLKLASENNRIMQGFTEGAPVAAPSATDTSSAALTSGAVPIFSTPSSATTPATPAAPAPAPTASAISPTPAPATPSTPTGATTATPAPAPTGTPAPAPTATGAPTTTGAPAPVAMPTSPAAITPPLAPTPFGAVTLETTPTDTITSGDPPTTPTTPITSSNAPNGIGTPITSGITSGAPSAPPAALPTATTTLPTSAPNPNPASNAGPTLNPGPAPNPSPTPNPNPTPPAGPIFS